VRCTWRTLGHKREMHLPSGKLCNQHTVTQYQEGVLLQTYDVAKHNEGAGLEQNGQVSGSAMLTGRWRHSEHTEQYRRKPQMYSRTCLLFGVAGTASHRHLGPAPALH
jgi:hypothetical protein